MMTFTNACRELKCPHCAREPLLLGPGSMTCGTCQRSYPVVDGIPRFVSPENYAETFGFQWLEHPATQLDSFTGVPISEKRFFEATRWPRDLTGQRVLEAGSGAGRFTEVICKAGAEVFSFDYSRAVEANHHNNARFPNLFLFQADIFKIPLEAGSFDKVCCLGVLQHTPDPPAAFRSLATFLRPGGEIVIDVYRKSFAAMLSWKYLLRPITTRVAHERLYSATRVTVGALAPLGRWLRRIGGRAGARLIPIAEYSHLGLSASQSLEWSVLDTFDMYAPKYDYPQTTADVRRWFENAGLTDVWIGPGPNGIVGRARRRPAA